MASTWLKRDGTVGGQPRVCKHHGRSAVSAMHRHATRSFAMQCNAMKCHAGPAAATMDGETCQRSRRSRQKPLSPFASPWMPKKLNLQRGRGVSTCLRCVSRRMISNQKRAPRLALRCTGWGEPTSEPRFSGVARKAGETRLCARIRATRASPAAALHPRHSHRTEARPVSTPTFWISPQSH